jgi:hypothetical protein
MILGNNMMKRILFLICIIIVLPINMWSQTIATAVNTAEFIVSNPLVITCTSGQVSDLTPGMCYEIKTNGDINPPDASGNSNIGFMSWNIFGQIGATITLAFNLPDGAFDPLSGVSLPITYGPFDGIFDNTGAGDGLTGNAFDVRVPYTNSLGALGSADVYVAYKICTPTNIPAGDYLANFYGIVSISGL